MNKEKNIRNRIDASINIYGFTKRQETICTK